LHLFYLQVSFDYWKVIGVCLRGQLEFPFSIQEKKKRKEKKQITKPKKRIKKK
jgi:hypothetical protein